MRSRWVPVDRSNSKVATEQIQMIRSPIQVFVRTRPVTDFAHEAIRIEPDGSTVNIHLNRLAGSSIGLNNLQQDWSFKFAKVLHNESQEAMFDACARDMVMPFAAQSTSQLNLQ